jgi:transcription initiation factor TFIID subunit 11
MSLVSGSVAGTTMSKRGRKKKVKAGAGGGDELGGGKGKSKDGADGAKSKRRQSQDISADEDEGGEEMAVQMAERTQEERQKDIEQRAMLVRCLDEDQFSRYEAWRSSRLSDAVVRRVSFPSSGMLLLIWLC